LLLAGRRAGWLQQGIGQVAANNVDGLEAWPLTVFDCAWKDWTFFLGLEQHNQATGESS